MGCEITKINLSDTGTLESLVEHRRVFNLKHCELNIFETYQKTSNVVLSYNGLVVSSMMRGRKTMSVMDSDTFDFLPGESVILPEGVSMNVGFPDADLHHPVQCATLALDWDMVEHNLDFLNDQYPNLQPPYEWKLNFERYHFVNNKELALSINRLISISMEDDSAKDALADLSLKFLLLRLIQTQNLASVNEKRLTNNPFQSLVIHISENLTEKLSVDMLAKKAGMSQSAFFQSFKEVFGITPMEYVLRARIELAKKIMADNDISITEACYRSGFNSLSYFIRIFKRLEGITPKQYRD